MALALLVEDDGLVVEEMVRHLRKGGREVVAVEWLEFATS